MCYGARRTEVDGKDVASQAGDNREGQQNRADDERARLAALLLPHQPRATEEWPPPAPRPYRSRFSARADRLVHVPQLRSPRATAITFEQRIFQAVYCRDRGLSEAPRDGPETSEKTPTGDSMMRRAVFLACLRGAFFSAASPDSIETLLDVDKMRFGSRGSIAADKEAYRPLAPPHILTAPVQPPSPPPGRTGTTASRVR